MRDRNVRRLVRQSQRYHRLNVPFASIEPRLDEVESLPNLENMASSDESNDEKIGRFADAALASLFYFELDELTEFVGGCYEGSGSIRCTLSSDKQHLEALIDWMCTKQAAFHLDSRMLLLITNDADCFNADGQFRIRVDLRIQSGFSVTLTYGNSEHFHISASPFERTKLEKRQGLSAWFGRADHKRKRGPESRSRSPKRRRM